MVLTVDITNNFSINKLSDLRKLNMEGIKPNKSLIARTLGVSRTTVSKYVKGYEAKVKRNKGSKLDKYYKAIEDLLYTDVMTKNKIFHYKRNLYDYCIEKEIIKNVSESGFKHWLGKKEKLNEYFKSSINKKAEIRFETGQGEQAQLDWKESMKIRLKNGKEIEINILVLILSYSRFRYYGLSLSKSQDVLFHHLDKAFESFEGIPKIILTDNMKTVMDEARTQYSKGKVNDRFAEFGNDYGFKVMPCIAARAKTKAKVEQQMRILDYLQSFNGELTFEELIQKVSELNEKENNRYHSSYGKIPKIALQKEKGSLAPLPHERLRNHYKIATTPVKVDNSSLISYKSNKYSVPPKYIGKKLSIQVFENQLHIYYNTTLVTIHQINYNKGNIFYEEKHYKDILINSRMFKLDDIDKIAENNLSKLGGKIDD